MVLRIRLKLLVLIVVTAILLAGITYASSQKQAGSAAPSPVAWKPVGTGNPADYAGAATCQECHKQVSTQFSKTPHASGSHSQSTYAAGCEGCHGPGKKHVEGMKAAQGDDDKIEAAMKLIYAFRGSAAQNSERCLGCHQTSHDQASFDRSEHKLRGVDCQTCHAPHLTGIGTAKPDASFRTQAQIFMPIRPSEEARWLKSGLLRKSQPDLCYQCHKTAEAQFALPSHHRVPEGLMKCTDCHNSHGTRNQVMLRDTNWEVCVKCHTEKRGPFVFEHAPVKAEGCASCHSPHGTINRMLLLRREGRFLCLQCHVNPQAPNVPHGRLSFATRGECVRCHSSVHGSNHSQFFLD